MTQDACTVCNFTGHKAGKCKTAKNKQNWGGWPATEPAVWPQPGGSAQNARAPPQQQSQQQSQQPAQATGGVAAVSAHCAGYQLSTWSVCLGAVDSPDNSARLRKPSNCALRRLAGQINKVNREPT